MTEVVSCSEVRRISLIVAVLGDAPHLHRLLDSLVKQGDAELEVFIIDQNPDDRLLAQIGLYRERLSLYHLRSDPGLSKARNAGLRHATGDLVAFPDDDCWYPASLLSELRAHFSRRPEIAGLTCRCTDECGRLAAGAEDRCSGRVTKHNVWGRGVSATIFLRNHVISDVGHFDMSLGLGASTPYQSGEETDLLLRAIRRNHHIHYEATLRVHHPLPPHARHPQAVRRAWKYGLGMGKVLRAHEYPPHHMVQHFAGPILGATLSLLKGDMARAQVRLARAIGRYQGWRGGRVRDPSSWLRA